jgi:hypothetical protein
MSNIKALDKEIAKHKDEGAALGGQGFGGSFGSNGPRTSSSSFRDAVSVPVAGGMLSPAKVGQGYGARWTKKFSKGGSASSRADGIAQRGKTKGRCL